MNPNPRYTLVVSTCDAYIDALPPLFALFRKYWPSLDVPIVLNTETAAYQHEGFEIVCPRVCLGLPDPQSMSWSLRLKRTLVQAVHTELVLHYLDDFYLRSPVNTERLDICLGLMTGNQRVACTLLFSCPKPFTPMQEHPWLVKRSKSAPYLFSLQAGLWRKDRLLHFLRDHESPWRFERWGSLRGRRYPDEFYAAAPIDGKQSILDYYPSIHGLSKGMWRPKTRELFETECISIDTSVRGVMPQGWVPPPPRRRNWFKTAWNIWRSLCP